MPTMLLQISLTVDQSARDVSLKGSFSMNNAQVFTCIGMWKGTTAAIRKLEKSLTLQGQDHLELKAVIHIVILKSVTL